MRYMLAVMAILAGVGLAWLCINDCLPTVYLATEDLPAETLTPWILLTPVSVILTGLLGGAMVAGGSYFLARAWR